jgi:hypothetical protein
MVKMDCNSTDLMTLREPQAKITQQKEPLTERMRRMYSGAGDLEVEDKSGRLERLVATTWRTTGNECPRSQHSESGPATRD